MKKNILLIIGNGFDLELGLKSSYKDFIDSDIYKGMAQRLSENPAYKKNWNLNIDEDIPLFQYFQIISNIQNWIDLEMELGKLASRKVRIINNGIIEETPAKSTPFMKSSFYLLCDCLDTYLSTLRHRPKPNNYASDLITILATNSYNNVQIVTFNYTDIEKVTGYGIKVPIHHIHGKIADGTDSNLILGVQDNIEVDKSFSYIIKSHNPSYQSIHIIDLLNIADEIIFFGLSFGETDYQYFSEFFKSQCERISPEKRKKIRIFTYNEDSRLDILFQLRVMNNKQTRLFFENSDFMLYRTEDKIDDSKIRSYFQELISEL